MLDSVKGYVYDRRWKLTRAVTVTGGVYMVGRYVVNRLEEVRDKVVQDRIARDNLRRRFQQNQEDVAYTIMALLPTLSEKILREMDVESITHELQSKSKASRIRPAQIEPPVLPTPSESSLASSIEMLQHDREQDVRSDVGSGMSESIYGGEDFSVVLESRVASASSLSPSSSHHKPSASSPAMTGSPAQTSPDLPSGLQLSDSIITTNSSILSYGNPESGLSEAQSSGSLAPSITPSDSSLNSRSKAELWKEIKILTFTRTLTILYSTTLLSLFTAIQLSILGRSKYVQSVLQLEKDERMKELLQGGAGVLSWVEDEGEKEGIVDEAIGEEMEMLYLTLSWWILHVGWKDVGERVRRGVEEVFDEVSLKTKLSIVDLHRLISDVRRRVEHEITFEGRERRVNFLSALLPPTPETLHHLLAQNNLPTPLSPFSPTSTTTLFTYLLTTTRQTVSSPDFERVLEVAMDEATGILLEGLRKNVFVEHGYGHGIDDAGTGASSGAGSANELKIRLVGLLPGLARWSHLALNGMPNELIDGLLGMREFEALSAIIFAEFEERFR